MERSDAVSFSSAHFKITPDEDKSTNPGIYGNALAHWIATQLKERGIVAHDVVPEDWGWCVIAYTKPVRVNIAVANIDGSATRWRLFVFAERGPLQLLKSSSELKKHAALLCEHLTPIVTSIPDVTDISWEGSI